MGAAHVDTGGNLPARGRGLLLTRTLLAAGMLCALWGGLQLLLVAHHMAGPFCVIFRGNSRQVDLAPGLWVQGMMPY